MSQLKRLKHLKIPFEEIKNATKNFKECIGRGGYGMVFKGELVISGKSTQVAIKRLNERYGQGAKEFLTEIELLSGQRHPNLIYLVGYCDDGQEKIIVYEFAENGSLDQYLRRSNTSRPLTWLERLNICVGAARGLHYLHNHVGMHQAIIHRDIKSANILIDKNWNAKVSDLGLSELCFVGLNRSFVVTNPCGTPGYCEPEYKETTVVTKESDVYSFGMVLFEVLCGMLCTIKEDTGFSLSSSSAKKHYEENRLDEIVDPSLKGEMSLDSRNSFAAIAYGCMHDDRSNRPTMGLVVKWLEELLNFQMIKSEKVRRIFQLYDRNQDGGLNQNELKALLVATNPDLKYCSPEEMRRELELVFRRFNDFIDGEKGLTCDGLLQVYDRDGDLDRDYGALGLKVISHIDKEPHFSVWDRFEKVRRIFQHFDMNDDGGLNRYELAALVATKYPNFRHGDKRIQTAVKYCFNEYKEYIDGEKGLTFKGVLLMYYQAHLDLDLTFQALRLGFKTKIDDQVAMGQMKRNLVDVHGWQILEMWKKLVDVQGWLIVFLVLLVFAYLLDHHHQWGEFLRYPLKMCRMLMTTIFNILWGLASGFADFGKGLLVELVLRFAFLAFVFVLIELVSTLPLLVGVIVRFVTSNMMYIWNEHNKIYFLD